MVSRSRLNKSLLSQSLMFPGWTLQAKLQLGSTHTDPNICCRLSQYLPCLAVAGQQVKRAWGGVCEPDMYIVHVRMCDAHWLTSASNVSQCHDLIAAGQCCMIVFTCWHVLALQ